MTVLLTAIKQRFDYIFCINNLDFVRTNSLVHSLESFPIGTATLLCAILLNGSFCLCISCNEDRNISIHKYALALSPLRMPGLTLMQL